MIWRFVWRVGLSGLVMGATFGAVYGTAVGTGLRDLTNPTMLGVVFGGFFGLIMGVVTGLVLAQVTMRYRAGVLPVNYRRNMAAIAFAVASVTGGLLTKLMLFGPSLRATDWGVLLLLAFAGGIGAALTAYWVTGQRLPEFQR